jgi:predicted ABC-type exoprotein transport system permease subunit
MKPETDYRNLSRAWLKYDGQSHLVLSLILAFLAVQASYWTYWTAANDMWVESALIAALAAIMWTRTVSNARHAIRCMGEAGE